MPDIRRTDEEVFVDQPGGGYTASRTTTVTEGPTPIIEEVIVDEGTPWTWVALSLVVLLALLLFFVYTAQQPATVTTGPSSVPTVRETQLVPMSPIERTVQAPPVIITQPAAPPPIIMPPAPAVTQTVPGPVMTETVPGPTVTETIQAPPAATEVSPP